MAMILMIVVERGRGWIFRLHSVKWSIGNSLASFPRTASLAPMTNRNEQHLTDEQMNELVIADVNDPSAWGDPIVVGPSKGPRRIRHAKHLELASKFYVLSVLHRLGADASLTFSQSDN